jgi:hypothetical protein
MHLYFTHNPGVKTFCHSLFDPIHTIGSVGNLSPHPIFCTHEKNAENTDDLFDRDVSFTGF